MITIRASVGYAGVNHRDDVRAIQQALNSLPLGRRPRVPLVVDGICGPKTRAAITHFQQTVFRWSDGRINLRGPTLDALNYSLEPATPAPSVRPLTPAEFPQPLPGQVPPAPATGVVLGHATCVAGDCMLTNPEDGTTVRMLSGRYPLSPGARVSTAQGTARITYSDGHAFDVPPNTMAVIVRPQDGPTRRGGSRASLATGNLERRLAELAGHP